MPNEHLAAVEMNGCNEAVFFWETIRDSRIIDSLLRAWHFEVATHHPEVIIFANLEPVKLASRTSLRQRLAPGFRGEPDDAHADDIDHADHRAGPGLGIAELRKAFHQGKEIADLQ